MTGDRESALLALKWQIEAGADEAIGAQPVDRTAAPPAKTPPPAARPARARQAKLWQPAPGPLESAETSVSTARQMAAEAADLTQLRVALERFEGCPLKETAMNLVFADGSPESRVMIVGEGPGGEEDRQGLPFVGPSGQLLDRMLAAIGLDRTSAYITNLLFWRPPGNRTPTGTEISACLPFVERHIELADPQYLLLAGGISAKTLLGRNQGILKLRGHWAHYQHAGMARPIPALASLHPAYLLRQPGQKRLAWRDFLLLREALDSGRDPILATPAKS